MQGLSFSFVMISPGVQ